MKIKPIFDINSVDRSEFADMGNILEQKRKDFYRGMLRCQEQCIQQVIDAGLNPSDFILLEKTETEDYIMTYKCWAERRMKI
jgi:hypothetical protein